MCVYVCTRRLPPPGPRPEGYRGPNGVTRATLQVKRKRPPGRAEKAAGDRGRRRGTRCAAPMADTPRGRWLINYVQSAWGDAFSDKELAESLCAEAANREALASFLHGAEAQLLLVTLGPSKRVLVTCGALPRDDSATLSPVGSRTCFFIRGSDAALQVNSVDNADGALVCGCLAGDAIAALSSLMESLYLPYSKAIAATGEGILNASAREVNDFAAEATRFAEELAEAAKTLGHGVALASPGRDLLQAIETFQAAGYGEEGGPLAQAAADPSVVHACHQLVNLWCESIEAFVDDPIAAEATRNASPGSDPMGEIEFWRRRTRSLTSIIDQIRERPYSTIISVLGFASRTGATRSGRASGAASELSWSTHVLLRRWKALDLRITEAANEAKDSCKYLSTLEKYLAALYDGSGPREVVDVLPALLNSIKIIQTVSRHYSTPERISRLLARITGRLIQSCQTYIMQDVGSPVGLWEADPGMLIERLRDCIALKEAYVRNFEKMRERLKALPRGTNFEFDEPLIFGRLDLFYRRICKLIEVFTTIGDFQGLASSKLEEIGGILRSFQALVQAFKQKQSDPLCFENNRYDRDFVEFNVRVGSLENRILDFIGEAFSQIPSLGILQSLQLLERFRAVFSRENLKAKLDQVYNTIFLAYGAELEQTLELYERHKEDPPISRHMPMVAGNIKWARALLTRIEEPMRLFQKDWGALNGRDRRIVKLYNRIVRTLVAFEYLWLQAWTRSIDASRAPLHATLLVRHPQDDQLYVNFDNEIFTLIREAKVLERLGIELPESAKIILLQEPKFKRYYSELSAAIRDYEAVIERVIPVTAIILRPQFLDFELRLRPGMVTLTWTSMNIGSYIDHIKESLTHLRQLVDSVNDVVENRIESHLRTVSSCRLLDLADGTEVLSPAAFVEQTCAQIRERAAGLQGKSIEMENAVDDLIAVATGSRSLHSSVPAASQEDIQRFKRHYHHFLFQALLHGTKQALLDVKRRLHAETHPLFEVSVALRASQVALEPDLQEVQEAINAVVRETVSVSKSVRDWSHSAGTSSAATTANNGAGQPAAAAASAASATGAGPGAAAGSASIAGLNGGGAHGSGEAAGEDGPAPTFFEYVSRDMDILRIVLLLTGVAKSAKASARTVLSRFAELRWLWSSTRNREYEEFAATRPTLRDYEREFDRFTSIEDSIAYEPEMYRTKFLALHLGRLKGAIVDACGEWKRLYARNLHASTRREMDALVEYVRVCRTRLDKPVHDLDSLRAMMQLLSELRSRESMTLATIERIIGAYAVLDSHLQPGFMTKEEMDSTSILRSSWRKTVDRASSRMLELSEEQHQFRQELLRDVAIFAQEVSIFRADFNANGPLVPGVKQNDAIQRLRRYNDEFSIKDRKRVLYAGGLELFSLPQKQYEDLEQTRRDLDLCDQLFGLIQVVNETLAAWCRKSWADVLKDIDGMQKTVESFAAQVRRIPKRMRDYESFIDLRNVVDDYLVLLPMLAELGKESILERHWAELLGLAGATDSLPVKTILRGDLTLQQLVDLRLHRFREEIEVISYAADKELKIDMSIQEIAKHWATAEFQFGRLKGRHGAHVIKATGIVQEELEEAQMSLQSTLTLRHVGPFRSECQELLKDLFEVSEALDMIIKVQSLWSSLESVFTGGDIARQLPQESKRFARINKDFQRIVDRAVETKVIMQVCKNTTLQTALPAMYPELERCQKSLDSYLEQKRYRFPRFYFVSNSVLLQILSKGSDPVSMNAHYGKVFDAIDHVEHSAADKSIIHSFVGKKYVEVPFSSSVRCDGNVEDWLNSLLRQMRITMKDHVRNCAASIFGAEGGACASEKTFRTFVDTNLAQFALLGLQLLWTSAMENALNASAKGAGRSAQRVMKENCSLLQRILGWLSGWCLGDLGEACNRRKIETLITIHLNQRDVADDMRAMVKQGRLKDGASDFEWLKQARFYFDPYGRDDLNADGQCVVSITDVEFVYQCEFLGVKERLVVTPLTDRCYITLAQALGSCLGGAPAGPAGTGKTETIKDLAASLGTPVLVLNGSESMSATDCGKVFKGLAMAGMWGCFDEFDRILLPVLSVVAQQLLATLNAKRANAKRFRFPGEEEWVPLKPCGFFITMNPGYAGRQRLPENLKALFRYVAMMKPNFEWIIRVKLCSVGYSSYSLLARKFFVLYDTAREQLSAQRHYDWGLRNMLAVLRSCGAIKRDNVNEPEQLLIHNILRDMNLSKLIAQDVPLFLSLLDDLFPVGTAGGDENAASAGLEGHIDAALAAAGLVKCPTWVRKITQLHDTSLVRHGIMLVGPAGGGKTQILKVLTRVLHDTTRVPHKEIRLNPKAMRAPVLYGEVDTLTGEWVTGVFAAIWAKCNAAGVSSRNWIVLDGPVDTIWIEDLNTVLDDNKVLTLSNGDRFPMMDNVKLIFEVETLVNASPATVSRAGIIYVSATDLDWHPVAEAWIGKQAEDTQHVLRGLFDKYLGLRAGGAGPLFAFLGRSCHLTGKVSRVAAVERLLMTMNHLLNVGGTSAAAPAAPQEPGARIASLSDVRPSGGEEFQALLERYFLFSLAWGVGGIYGTEHSGDRAALDAHLRGIDASAMPSAEVESAGPEAEVPTIFDFTVGEDGRWVPVRPPAWELPASMRALRDDEPLDFSSILVPTVDSTRALTLLRACWQQRSPALLVGASGTGKTATVLMASRDLPGQVVRKIVQLSSVTTPARFQEAMEADLEKRGGKIFGPAQGREMLVFLDDLSMPLANEWGDQPTLELVREAVELSGFPFLDKDKRGDWKTLEDVCYVAAMAAPGAGAKDIPARLKRHFFAFSLPPPRAGSIKGIYRQIISARFTSGAGFGSATLAVAGLLTAATTRLWNDLQRRFLPTPKKFHYSFTMREISRVFQGVLFTPIATVKAGGGPRRADGTQRGVPNFLLSLWIHECRRAFEDKLVNDADKGAFGELLTKTVDDVFGDCVGAGVVRDALKQPVHMVTFMGDDVLDDDGAVLEEAPRVYEDAGSLAAVNDRAEKFMRQLGEEMPQKRMNLVLFDDAIAHLIRIVRVMSLPRMSGLLVGVGGSGKRSLTRLAAFICRKQLFYPEVSLTKSYTVQSLKDDLKAAYEVAGHQRRGAVFVICDSDVKDESFLELINTVLRAGDVPNLFQKEEMLAMGSDLQPAFERDRPGAPATPENLSAYFLEQVRSNLTVVLCMSPQHPHFSRHSRRFPGLFDYPSIDWFLRWPEEALVAVSHGVLKDFSVEGSSEEKKRLLVHMGTTHQGVAAVCDEYQDKLRRSVALTPKSYLSFLDMYRHMYEEKVAEVREKEARVLLGLQKLTRGAEDVEALKAKLVVKKKALESMTEESNEMLRALETESAAARQEQNQVEDITSRCEVEAERIESEKLECEADLAMATPLVDRANAAIDRITPSDIVEIKTNRKPLDIIKLVFDGVLLLFQRPLNPVRPTMLNVKRSELPFIETSFVPHGQSMVSDTQFLSRVIAFSRIGKDQINEETVELLLPYLELDIFRPAVAKSASQAAEGLCVWVCAMKDYCIASKIVKPKLEALRVAEAMLSTKLRELAEAKAHLETVRAKVDGLQARFEAKVLEKKHIEEEARQMQRKTFQASALIEALGGERERWSREASEFADTKHKLIGDCATVAAFVSYCGPFNQEFRRQMVRQTFVGSARAHGVPASEDLDVIPFLVNQVTISDWNRDGLPRDNLSIENGILITASKRFPLLIDPQGQALSWVRRRERMHTSDAHSLKGGVTTLGNSRFREQLEHSMENGRTLIVVGIEHDLDPMLDPLLEGEFFYKGGRKHVMILDRAHVVDDEFRLFFFTRLLNPRLSAELQAKTSVIDFTVTQKGLEEQLLGTVISHEKVALEDRLRDVLEDVSHNAKALDELNDALLQRLTENAGNLLEDEELVGVLNATKVKANDVMAKLVSAQETREQIREQREQYRPVAERGAALYFVITEMALVNPMYQTSLEQFDTLFVRSMDQSSRTPPIRRVPNIIEHLTYAVYRYVNRGVYEEHKLTLKMLIALKIFLSAGAITPDHVMVLLRGGAGLEEQAIQSVPFPWLDPDAWRNANELSMKSRFFKDLPTNMNRNEAVWQAFVEGPAPEAAAIPDFEAPLSELSPGLSAFHRLLLVRCLRRDRMLLACKNFVASAREVDVGGGGASGSVPCLGPEYVEAVTDELSDVIDGTHKLTPIIFLLSTGADPTEAINGLARKRKLLPPSVVSMGEGQEGPALATVAAVAAAGGYVLLQNTELGLNLMPQLEEMVLSLSEEDTHDDFRLLLTALPHPDYPLSLLHMSVKVTLEAPKGLKAGLLRSYVSAIDQDRLEKVDTREYRALLFVLCFLHSTVQERRKFRSLGWCVPYEFNAGDLTASVNFLEKHLYNETISFPALRYVIGEVLYGGKITDELDRTLFNAYTRKWIGPATLEPGFCLAAAPPSAGGSAFRYEVLDLNDVGAVREAVQETYPEVDAPELFGLHANADLNYVMSETSKLLSSISDTQPKGSGSLIGGAARDAQALERVQALLGDLPEDFSRDRYLQQIRALGGLERPLNMFLCRETQRLREVIAKVREDLNRLLLAISGEVIMTDELDRCLGSIHVAEPPRDWVYRRTGDEFSWICPQLGRWFSSLLVRDAQIRQWLSHGRPRTFQLSAFCSPAAMLTAMKQEVVRARASPKWTLDSVVYKTRVVSGPRNADRGAAGQASARVGGGGQGAGSGAPGGDGILVHGVHISGAALRHGRLEEAEPKVLFQEMPLLHFSADLEASEAKAADGADHFHACLYKYAVRQDKFLVCKSIPLNAGNRDPDHWVLRNVALVLSTDH